MDFPFSLSGGLPGELSLPNTDAKKFENSLLGNELFLSTFHDTLSGISSVPMSISQNLRAMSASDKSGKSDKPSEKGEELTDINAGEKLVEQSQSTKVKVPAGTYVMHVSILAGDWVNILMVFFLYLLQKVSQRAVVVLKQRRNNLLSC